MSDDNSNDVVMVECTDAPAPCKTPIDEEEDRPIMQLFYRLISNDSKQNTVLTNVQIVAILQKEFNIDVTTLHDLEVDIYLNIVKKFLKDWPQWDSFDQGINSLKKQRAHHSIKRTLEKKYINLKKYLQDIIEATRPRAQETVAKLVEEHSKIMENVDTSKTILEINCTRNQLNGLIFNQPAEDNNIFNYIEHKPTLIKLVDIPLEAMLNYRKFQVKLDLKSLSLIRTANHNLQHVLVNKKNGQQTPRKILSENVQIKDVKLPMKIIQKEELINALSNILSLVQETQIQRFLKSVFNVIIKDLEIMRQDIKVPAMYRFHCNKYPYYRKLCKTSNQTQLGSPYNLYIEETLSPLTLYYISKVDEQESLPPKTNWIMLECMECGLKFKDLEEINGLFEHFNTIHIYEQDWLCTNCEKSFPMVEVCQNRWYHDCETSS